MRRRGSDKRLGLQLNIKRMIYGLPFMKWYRLRRVEQVARNPRRTGEGFLMASSSPQIFADEWEIGERNALRLRFAECDAFIDIGANAGFYSLWAARHGLPVVAVEPDEGNLVMLRENLRGTDVEIVPCAVDREAGSVFLFGDGDMASMHRRWQGVARFFRRRVATVRLDDLVGRRFDDRRLLIKIDVEGAEDRVLEGATETLVREPRPVWLIETLQQFPQGGQNPAYEKVHALMSGLGYATIDLGDENFVFARKT